MAPEDETGMLPLHHPTKYPAARRQRDYLLVRNMIDPKKMLVLIISSEQLRPTNTIPLNKPIGIVKLTLEVLDLHLKHSKIIIGSILEMDHRITKKTDDLRNELRKQRNGLNCPPERSHPQ